MEQARKLDDVPLKDLASLVREFASELDDSARRLTKKGARRACSTLERPSARIDAPAVHRATPLERYTADVDRFRLRRHRFPR